MKHLILATVLLFSVSALGWTRELKPSEHPLVGVWIDTTDCSGEMELFADGTARGVLGDYFQWQILPDGRFKADTPSEGSVKITTSDSVDLQQGIMRMNNRDLRRSSPQIAGTCSELRQAGAAESSADQSRSSADDYLRKDAESSRRCVAGGGGGEWSDCSIQKMGLNLQAFRKLMESAEKSLQSCQQHAEAAITQWPTFPLAYDSQQRCIFGMLEILDDWRLLPDYDPDLEKLRNLEPRLAEVQHRSDLKRDAAELRKQVKDLRAALDEKRSEIEGKLAKMAPPLEEIETKRVAVIESLLDSFRRKMNAAPPDRKAFMLASLAWVHAISTRPELSDGAQALDYARQAVAMEPRSAYFATVLAAAYARAGNFREAQRTMEQAIALTDTNPSCESWRTWQRSLLDLYRQGTPYTMKSIHRRFGRELSHWWGRHRSDWEGARDARYAMDSGCRL